MQGLVWRLKALDPEASESLKVIAYFDALVDGHASAQVLLSGAAVLSGCAAGYIAGLDGQCGLGHDHVETMEPAGPHMQLCDASHCPDTGSVSHHFVPEHFCSSHIDERRRQV